MYSRSGEHVDLPSGELESCGGGGGGGGGGPARRGRLRPGAGLMRYRLFGSSGLRVSELFLGAMTFGEQGGVGAGPEERPGGSSMPTPTRAATSLTRRSTTGAAPARRSSAGFSPAAGTVSWWPPSTPSPATGQIPTPRAITARICGCRWRRAAYAQSVFWFQVLDFIEDPDDPNEPGTGMPDHVARPEPAPALHHGPGRQAGEEPVHLDLRPARYRSRRRSGFSRSGRRTSLTTGGPMAVAGSRSLIPKATSSADLLSREPARSGATT